MIDSVFSEDHNLLTVFHETLRILMHTVYKQLIIEIFLHFGDIYHATVSQFLEFGIVDICAVKCHYLIVMVMAWSKHERVVVRRRSELYIAWNTLVSVYY